MRSLEVHYDINSWIYVSVGIYSAFCIAKIAWAINRTSAKLSKTAYTIYSRLSQKRCNILAIFLCLKIHLGWQVAILGGHLLLIAFLLVIEQDCAPVGITITESIRIIVRDPLVDQVLKLAYSAVEFIWTTWTNLLFHFNNYLKKFNIYLLAII